MSYFTNTLCHIHRNYKLHSKGNCKVCYIFLSHFFGSERTIDNHWRISHHHLQNGSLWIMEQCLKCQIITATICPIQAKVQLLRRKGIFMDFFLTLWQLPDNFSAICQKYSSKRHLATVLMYTQQVKLFLKVFT